MNPIILYEGKNNQKDLNELRKTKKIWKISDIYIPQLKELFEINNPHLINSLNFSLQRDKFVNKKTKKTTGLFGNWIYYPWNGHLVHTVNEWDYFLLRTNRNKNLIKKHEQQKLYNSCVGVIGLSVGNSIATSLSYKGISKNIKLAEYDSLETTNLNRIRAGLKDVGIPKIEITARQIYEIDPYTNLKLYSKGITKKNLNEFITKKPVPKIIFEVIDDFEMKILLRLRAREKRIPVVMFANLGDRVLVDIERYDLNKKTPLFNGVLGNLPERILKNPKKDQNKYAVEIVSTENIPKRALESIKHINKTLVGRPQLSSTVSISASIATYITRQIILGKTMSGGRKIFDLEQIM